MMVTKLIGLGIACVIWVLLSVGASTPASASCANAAPAYETHVSPCDTPCDNCGGQVATHHVARCIGWADGRFWFVDESGRRHWAEFQHYVGDRFFYTGSESLQFIDHLHPYNRRT